MRPPLSRHAAWRVCGAIGAAALMATAAYAVRLEPDQARRLRLAMTAPVSLTIPATGGFAGRATINLKLGAP